MKSNNFITADLSTYDPQQTMPFYQSVFGWTFHKQPATSDETHGAYLGNQEIASIYQTPEKFQKMNMPHFWMSYICVNDVAQTVATARSLGGIIEAELDTGYGKVALIRDPQGAGFTVYQGDDLPVTRTKDQANTLIWNELHISDAKNIVPFYEGIFDWTFAQSDDEPSHYRIVNGDGEYIADALEIPNEIKGKYEYWVCTFGVSDVRATKQAILDNGGTVIMDEGERIMMSDNSEQAFFYIQAVDSVATQKTITHSNATTRMNNEQTHSFTSLARDWLPEWLTRKWKSILGLVIIFLGILTEQYWLFGVFFLIWFIMDLRAGATYLFEPISKQKDPALYWVVMATWGVLCVFSFMQ